ncbi:chemotaxis protein MotC [Pseudaminobacter sp. NGMCC 1.201702]|uniref:chemotaxis protein MotC n=1 Tax=Pseudaminobacter sp. NGMCC 1.201702 TaxID=3391825 RepID=UPI0039F0B0BD
MRKARALYGLAGLALLAASLPAPLRAESAGQLAPFQMVRSLQLVQDRIAAGDHAAMPMQRKLLEMIDARLIAADKEIFDEPRNYRALLVYGMSGGNPATIEKVLSRLNLDEEKRGIGRGVLDYLNGQTISARSTLGPIDPMKLEPGLGAFLALVKGSVASAENPQAALKLFDTVRLLGPGTLIEEAALRRSIDLAAGLGETERFTLASTQYVNRYLLSPYAAQFADSFVSGVVTLQASVDLERIADITAMMDAERRRTIYLRIARRAAIEGFKDLAAFASAKAEESTPAGTKDPRALLYASLSSVTSGTASEINALLEDIDRRKLSQGDRKLYDAVAAVAAKLTSALPATGPATSPAVQEIEAPEALIPAAPGPGADAKASADPIEAELTEARRKLDEIDKLLAEDVQ